MVFRGIGAVAVDCHLRLRGIGGETVDSFYCIRGIEVLSVNCGIGIPVNLCAKKLMRTFILGIIP